MRTWTTKKPDWLLDSQKLLREMDDVKSFRPSPLVGNSSEHRINVRSYGLRARKLSNRTDGRVFGDFNRWVRTQARLADEV